MKKCFIQLFYVITFSVVTACGGGSSGSGPEPEQNIAPIASAGADASFEENTTVTLDASSSSDSDGSITSFSWQQTSGSPNVNLSGAETSRATFTAPDVNADTLLTFRVTVTDNDGATSSDTVTITVLKVNQQPVIDIPDNINAIGNEVVTLDGSNSEDPDGSIVSYEWQQVSGSIVTITNSNQAVASFTAPNTDTNLVFMLTVTDDDGASNSENITVTVTTSNGGGNTPPTANAGIDQSIEQNNLVTLDGSLSSDPDGTIVSYSWNQISGAPLVNLATPSAVVSSFTAPSVSTNTTLSFELTITDDGGATDSDSLNITITPATNPPGPGPILTDVRAYHFGNSLINHQFGEADNFTNILIWMHELSLYAGYTYAMSGQFGFGSQHASNLPPRAVWGIPNVTPANVDGVEMLDSQAWQDTNFNIVMFTPANFRQYYPADELGDFADITTETTATLFNYAESADPSNATYIIYENWADMAPYTSADFITEYPTESELAVYWNFVQNDFHDWWLNYHDIMLRDYPELHIRMIPVGPILGKLLTGTLSDINSVDLYEDSAPHGRPTLYFLAGLINYMGTYGTQAPPDYVVPDNVNSLVRENYNQIVSEIWVELQNFNDSSGNSRVFPN